MLFERYYHEHQIIATVAASSDVANLKFSKSVEVEGGVTIVDPRGLAKHAWYTILLHSMSGTLHNAFQAVKSVFGLAAALITRMW